MAKQEAESNLQTCETLKMTHLSKMYVVKDSNHSTEVFSIQESSVNFNFMTLLESQSYSLVTFAEKTNMFSHKLTFKLTGKLF